jgi:peptidylprolyl isomerase
VFVVRRSPLARSLTVVVAALLVGGSLAGCTAVFGGGGCEVAPGDASRAVSASGDIGDSPAVEFPTPLIAEAPQSSVLTVGDGDVVGGSAVVRGNTAYFDAETGEALAEAPQQFVTNEKGLALGAALACATAGSRIAFVGTVDEVSADPQIVNFLGGEDATVVAVIDVEQVFLSKANGFNQLPQDGMPTVVTAVDGTPGVSTTYQPVADEPRTALIKAGSGATVGEDDTVLLQARSWNWTGDRVTLGDVDLWETGVPAAVPPTVDALLGQQALADAILGSKVGSQLLIVIPREDAPGTATIYVFDVLGLVDAGD